MTHACSITLPPHGPAGQCEPLFVFAVELWSSQWRPVNDAPEQCAVCGFRFMTEQVDEIDRLMVEAAKAYTYEEDRS